MKIIAHSKDRETILQCGHTFGKLEEEYEVTPEQYAWLRDHYAHGVTIVSVVDESAAKEPAKKPKA